MISFNTRDEYQRKPIAEKVITLLASDIAVSPMVIDGGWGTGKTEFCLKLIDLIDTSDPKPFIPIYVDAFKADHADQPLMTLLAAVLEKLPDSDSKTTLKQKAIPMLRFGMKTAGKAALSWLLKANPDDLAEGMQDEIKNAGNNAIDHSVEALLEDHIEAEKNLQTLRSALEKVASEQPIVLFVDELDRCRPDFAVALLEVIKHIFDVEGVKFVLITNTQQLKAAINHSYGNDVDAQRYLDKFLAFKLNLPTKVKVDYQSEDCSVQHFKMLIAESPTLNASTLKKLDYGHVGTLCYLIRIHRRSLREVETLIRYLEVYQKLCNGLKEDIIFGFALFKAIGVYIYTFESILSENIVSKKLDGNDLLTCFGIESIELLDTEEYRGWITDVLRMLGRECSTNFEQFIIKDEQTTISFKQAKQNYFKGERAPDRIFSIIEDSIRKMMLQ